ncbi:hypothetical protein HF072_02350 [Bacillus sp. RO3]|nr:hypothetical protein [Bacillus sp. RO3]
MTIKKKLGMGILTGVMGLSLVGGGTWAAFTDEEVAMNKFAAGTLNLQLEDKGGAVLTQSLDISNMKPGDSKDFDIFFDNIGTLGIKNVFMSGAKVANSFQDAPAPDGESENFSNSEAQFLKQFSIKVFDGAKNKVLGSMNLNEFLKGTTSKDAIKKATEPGMGLPVDADRDKIVVTIKFEDEGNQNKFMGDAAQFKLLFQATQQDGIHINHDGTGSNGEGVVEDDKGYIIYNENQPYKVNDPIGNEGGNN